MNPQAASRNLTLPSILIVEDEHDTRVVLRSTLEDQGYAVFSATHGIDAWGLLEKGIRPGLILLDLMLPFMSGDEFLKKLHGDERYRSIPVLVFSAAEANHSPVLGVPFIRKPGDLCQLLRMIRECHSGKVSACGVAH